MGNQPRTFGETSLPERLSALLHEVRQVSREADKRAAAQSKRGSQAYATRLAKLLEDGIAHSGSTHAVVYLAAAAEHGVLAPHHFELVAPAIARLRDPAVRALFWTIARRWR